MRKHPWRGGEAERQSCELKEPSAVEEAQVLRVLRVDEDMELGVLEVDRGSPGRKKQRLDDRPECLHSEFPWVDEAVEGMQVDDGSPNAWFLLESKEENQKGFGWNRF